MNLPIRNSRMRLSQGQIFWREVGQGNTLVFLHGSWQDGDQWTGLIQDLDSNYHCLAPDLIGFGESENPSIHYSIALQVESLAEYLESLKVRQIYLVGHSLGGWIAASYALKYPEQVKGLILLSPEGIETQAHRKRWQGAKWLLNPVAYGLLRSLQSLKKVLKLEAIDRLLQRREVLLNSPTACKLLFNRRWAEIKAELLREQLAWLKAPVLLLQGEADRSDGAVLNHTYARHLPQAKLVTIPHAGKDVLQTDPEVVAAHIREFVNTVPVKR